tara:strand:- start:32 stop:208 length:177 start_codon:yes stop_codon:yes gene_type:complete
MLCKIKRKIVKISNFLEKLVQINGALTNLKRPTLIKREKDIKPRIEEKKRSQNNPITK